MAFGLNLRFLDDLPRLEDDARTMLDGLGRDASGLLDRLRLTVEADPAPAPAIPPPAAGSFDPGGILALLGAGGLTGFDGSPNIRNLDDLAVLARGLPEGLAGPDATGEVPTGSAALPRATVETATILAAAPRIVAALGPDAQVVEVRGQGFAVAESYADPVSGFSALRLTPLAGGPEVFAVDGLQIGSRADEVAAATLGRLQVESAAFREMIADAALVPLEGGRPVLLTGPSLGGAVAQAAAYETAEALVAAGAGFGPGAVQLVTVDALGGRDATEAVNGGVLDPAALGLIAALNIRTEGDIISQIGSHVGASLTLPAVDAAGNPVALNPAEAHVNAVSLLEVLGSDVLFAAGVPGAPAEIGGFAAASDAASEALVAGWLASGGREGPPGELQVPGRASFDPSGTVWSLDADLDGTVDITVRLAAPVSPATADLVLG